MQNVGDRIKVIVKRGPSVEQLSLRVKSIF